MGYMRDVHEGLSRRIGQKITELEFAGKVQGIV